MKTTEQKIKEAGFELETASKKFFNGLLMQIGAAVLVAIYMFSDEKKEIVLILWLATLTGLLGIVFMVSSFHHIGNAGKSLNS